MRAAACAAEGRTLALDLHDEDDIEEQRWHLQHPMREAVCVVEGNARELRVRLPELVLVGLGSSSRLLAARPTDSSWTCRCVVSVVSVILMFPELRPAVGAAGDDLRVSKNRR